MHPLQLFTVVFSLLFITHSVLGQGTLLSKSCTDSSTTIDVKRGTDHILCLNVDGEVIEEKNGSPFSIPLVSPVTRIAATDFGSFAVVSTGEVFGWGKWIPSSPFRHLPSRLELPNAVSILKCSTKRCIAKSGSTLFFWGENTHFSAGLGERDEAYDTPQQILFDRAAAVEKIVLTTDSSYLITESGETYAAGKVGLGATHPFFTKVNSDVAIEKARKGFSRRNLLQDISLQPDEFSSFVGTYNSLCNDNCSDSLRWSTFSANNLCSSSDVTCIDVDGTNRIISLGWENMGLSYSAAARGAFANFTLLESLDLSGNDFSSHESYALFDGLPERDIQVDFSNNSYCGVAPEHFLRHAAHWQTEGNTILCEVSSSEACNQLSIIDVVPDASYKYFDFQWVTLRIRSTNLTCLEEVLMSESIRVINHNGGLEQLGIIIKTDDAEAPFSVTVKIFEPNNGVNQDILLGLAWQYSSSSEVLPLSNKVAFRYTALATISEVWPWIVPVSSNVELTLDTSMENFRFSTVFCSSSISFIPAAPVSISENTVTCLSPSSTQPSIQLSLVQRRYNETAPIYQPLTSNSAIVYVQNELRYFNDYLTWSEEYTGLIQFSDKSFFLLPENKWSRSYTISMADRLGTCEIISSLLICKKPIFPLNSIAQSVMVVDFRLLEDGRELTKMKDMLLYRRSTIRSGIEFNLDNQPLTITADHSVFQSNIKLEYACVDMNTGRIFNATMNTNFTITCAPTRSNTTLSSEYERLDLMTAIRAQSISSDWINVGFDAVPYLIAGSSGLILSDSVLMNNSSLEVTLGSLVPKQTAVYCKLLGIRSIATIVTSTKYRCPIVVPAQGIYNVSLVYVDSDKPTAGEVLVSDTAEFSALAFGQILSLNSSYSFEKQAVVAVETDIRLLLTVSSYLCMYVTQNGTNQTVPATILSYNESSTTFACQLQSDRAGLLSVSIMAETTANQLPVTNTAAFEFMTYCFDISSGNSSVCSGHGHCIDYNTCQCDETMYTGTQCETPVCYGIDALDPEVCSGRGVCTEPDLCVCPSIWNGTICQYRIEDTCFGLFASDPLVCSSKGSCIAIDTCECTTPGYSGIMCADAIRFGRMQARWEEELSQLLLNADGSMFTTSDTATIWKMSIGDVNVTCKAASMLLVCTKPAMPVDPNYQLRVDFLKLFTNDTLHVNMGAFLSYRLGAVVEISRTLGIGDTTIRAKLDSASLSSNENTTYSCYDITNGITYSATYISADTIECHLKRAAAVPPPQILNIQLMVTIPVFSMSPIAISANTFSVSLFDRTYYTMNMTYATVAEPTYLKLSLNGSVPEAIRAFTTVYINSTAMATTLLSPSEVATSFQYNYGTTLIVSVWVYDIPITYSSILPIYYRAQAHASELVVNGGSAILLFDTIINNYTVPVQFFLKENSSLSTFNCTALSMYLLSCSMSRQQSAEYTKYTFDVIATMSGLEPEVMGIVSTTPIQLSIMDLYPVNVTVSQNVSQLRTSFPNSVYMSLASTFPAEHASLVYCSISFENTDLFPATKFIPPNTWLCDFNSEHTGLHELSLVFMDSIVPPFQLATPYTIHFDEVFFCDGIDSRDSSVCNGRGSCTYDNVCDCIDGYVGNNCQDVACFSISTHDVDVCSGRGTCVSSNKCECSSGTAGENCEISEVEIIQSFPNLVVHNTTFFLHLSDSLVYNDDVMDVACMDSAGVLYSGELRSVRSVACFLVHQSQQANVVEELSLNLWVRTKKTSVWTKASPSVTTSVAVLSTVSVSSKLQHIPTSSSQKLVTLPYLVPLSSRPYIRCKVGNNYVATLSSGVPSLDMFLCTFAAASSVKAETFALWYFDNGRSFETRVTEELGLVYADKGQLLQFNVTEAVIPSAGVALKTTIPKIVDNSAPADSFAYYCGYNDQFSEAFVQNDNATTLTLECTLYGNRTEVLDVTVWVFDKLKKERLQLSTNLLQFRFIGCETRDVNFVRDGNVIQVPDPPIVKIKSTQTHILLTIDEPTTSFRELTVSFSPASKDELINTPTCYYQTINSQDTASFDFYTISYSENCTRTVIASLPLKLLSDCPSSTIRAGSANGLATVSGTAYISTSYIDPDPMLPDDLRTVTQRYTFNFAGNFQTSSSAVDAGSGVAANLVVLNSTSFSTQLKPGIITTSADYQNREAIISFTIFTVKPLKISFISGHESAHNKPFTTTLIQSLELETEFYYATSYELKLQILANTTFCKLNGDYNLLFNVYDSDTDIQLGQAHTLVQVISDVDLCQADPTCNGNGVVVNSACQCFNNSEAGFWDPATNCSTCINSIYGMFCNVYCSANSSCNGNGVCAADGTCSCTRSDTAGHWSGSDCSSCATGYYDESTKCITTASDFFFLDSLTSIVGRIVLPFRLSSIDCSTVFDAGTLALLGSRAVCLWPNAAINDFETFVVHFGILPTLLPIHKLNITLGEYIIQVSVQMPNSAPRPWTRFIAPEILGVCDDLVLDASFSYSEDRRPLTFTFRIVDYIDSTGFYNAEKHDALQTYVTSLGTQTNRITIPTGLIDPSAVIYVSLQVKSAFDVYGTTVFRSIRKSSMAAPNVVIQGTALIQAYRSSSVIIATRVSFASCYPSNRTLSYQWSQVAGPSTVSMSGLKTTSSVLHIPAFFLPSLGTYEFQVTVTPVIAAASPNSASVTVTVQSSNLVATIRGGSQTVSTIQQLVLSSEGSFDPDRFIKTPTYLWTCQSLSNVSCSDVIIVTAYGNTTASNSSLTTSTVTLAKGNPAGVYRFTLTYSDPDTDRQSVTSADIRIIIDPLPTVYILSKSWIVNPNEKVELQAIAASPIGAKLYYKWSSLLLALTSSNLLSTSTARTLVIAPNSLAVSQTYTMTVEVTDLTYTATADVSIYVNPPPHPGTFSISPSSGKGISTVFELVYSNFVDFDSTEPLSATFGYYSDTGAETLLTQRIYDSVFRTALPVGSAANNYTITVFVRVYDYHGAFTEVTEVVTVSEPVDSDDVSVQANFAMSVIQDGLQQTLAEGDSGSALSLTSALADYLNPRTDTVNRNSTNVTNSTSSTNTTNSARSTFAVPDEYQQFCYNNCSFPQGVCTQLNSTVYSCVCDIEFTGDDCSRNITQLKLIKDALLSAMFEAVDANAMPADAQSVQQQASLLSKMTFSPNELSTDSQVACLGQLDSITSTSSSLITTDSASSILTSLSSLSQLIVPTVTNATVINNSTNTNTTSRSFSRRTMWLYAFASTVNGSSSSNYTDTNSTIPVNIVLDEKAKAFAEKTQNITEGIVTSLLSQQSPGQDAVVISTPSLSVGAQQLLVESATSAEVLLPVLEGMSAAPSAKLPNMTQFNATNTIETKIVVYKTNPFGWASNSANVSSPVLSMKMGSDGNEIEVRNLTEPIIIRIPHNYDLSIVQLNFSLPGIQPNCTYWDETLEVWSSEGCTFVNITDTEIICACNHLTSFSMLMSFIIPPISFLSFEDFGLLLNMSLDQADIAFFMGGFCLVYFILLGVVAYVDNRSKISNIDLLRARQEKAKAKELQTIADATKKTAAPQAATAQNNMPEFNMFELQTHGLNTEEIKEKAQKFYTQQGKRQFATPADAESIEKTMEEQLERQLSEANFEVEPLERQMLYSIQSAKHKPYIGTTRKLFMYMVTRHNWLSIIWMSNAIPLTRSRKLTILWVSLILSFVANTMFYANDKTNQVQSIVSGVISNLMTAPFTVFLIAIFSRIKPPKVRRKKPKSETSNSTAEIQMPNVIRVTNTNGNTVSAKREQTLPQQPATPRLREYSNIQPASSSASVPNANVELQILTEAPREETNNEEQNVGDIQFELSDGSDASNYTQSQRNPVEQTNSSNGLVGLVDNNELTSDGALVHNIANRIAVLRAKLAVAEETTAQAGSHNISVNSNNNATAVPDNGIPNELPPKPTRKRKLKKQTWRDRVTRHVETLDRILYTFEMGLQKKLRNNPATVLSILVLSSALYFGAIAVFLVLMELLMHRFWDRLMTMLVVVGSILGFSAVYLISYVRSKRTIFLMTGEWFSDLGLAVTLGTIGVLHIIGSIPFAVFFFKTDDILMEYFVPVEAYLFAMGAILIAIAVMVRRKPLAVEKQLVPYAIYLNIDGMPIVVKGRGKVKKGYVRFIPNWVQYIMYLVCWVAMGVCSVVIITYSLKFNSIQRSGWSTSTVTSLVQDIFIKEPLMIIMIAAIFMSAISVVTALLIRRAVRTTD